MFRPDDRGQRLAVAVTNSDGRSRTFSASSSVSGEPVTPSAWVNSARTPSDSGLAWSGSPQAFHFIGGSKSAGMRYSITYAVNQ